MSVCPASSSASRTAATWPSIMPLRPSSSRAGSRLRERHRAVPLERRVVVDAAAVVEHAAVAVVGELVEAEVGLHDERAGGCLDGDPRRDVEDAVGVGGARAARIAHLGHAEQHHAADARRPRPHRRLRAGSRASAARRPASTRSAPGRLTPSRTNIGSTSSAGCRRVSETRRRSAGVSRSRRGRTRGSGVELTTATSLRSQRRSSVERGPRDVATSDRVDERLGGALARDHVDPQPDLARHPSAVCGPMAATRIVSGIGPSCCCTCSATLPDVTSTRGRCRRARRRRPSPTPGRRPCGRRRRPRRGGPPRRGRSRAPASRSPSAGEHAQSTRAVGRGLPLLEQAARRSCPRSGTMSARYPAATSAAAVVSPTAATFVVSGITAPYDGEHVDGRRARDRRPSRSRRRRASSSAASSAGWSSVGAKLISGATTGDAPRARSAAATPSPHGPPRGTSTRQPASGLPRPTRAG